MNKEHLVTFVNLPTAGQKYVFFGTCPQKPCHYVDDTHCQPLCLAPINPALPARQDTCQAPAILAPGRSGFGENPRVA